jgi:hypothetical protein
MSPSCRAALASFGLLSAGCAGSDRADGDSAAAPGEDDVDQLAPFVAEPVWSADEMTAEAERLVALGFPDPNVPFDAYKALLAYRDDTCPNAGDQLVGQEMPEGGCLAASGAHFEGNTVIIETNVVEGADAIRGFQFGGDFLISDPSGAWLAGGGGMRFQTVRSNNGDVIWSGEAAGTWIDTRRDDWLGLGFSSTFTFGGASTADGRTLTMNGTVGVDGVYVQFVDVAWADACGGYPTGHLRIRDPSGVWADLDFADRCDGCGTLTHDTLDDATEACVDLSPFTSALAALEAG